ncbi:MAG: hypothetical protein ACKON8_05970, partial [Planctomycetota bacterium]
GLGKHRPGAGTQGHGPHDQGQNHARIQLSPKRSASSASHRNPHFSGLTGKNEKQKVCETNIPAVALPPARETVSLRQECVNHRPQQGFRESKRDR